MDISNIIRRRRKELGLTLLDIAKNLGVSESTVQRWETGNIKTIKYEHIISLSNLLNIEPATMMGLSPNSNIDVPIEDFAYYQELFSYCRALSAASRGKIMERARVLYELENDDIDIEVPEEYSGADAELVRRLREEDVKETIRECINKGDAELMRRDALKLGKAK